MRKHLKARSTIMQSETKFERRRFLARLAATGLGGSLIAHPAWSQGNPSLPNPAANTPLSQTLATYAASFRYESIPADVAMLAKRAVLDTMACAYSGYPAKLSKIAQDLARQSGATPPATL